MKMNKEIFNWAVFVVLFAGLMASCKKENLKCIKDNGEAATRTLDLADFSKVYLSIEAEVKITQGNTFSVEAIGPENVLNELDIWVNADDLMIESDRCFDLDEPLTILIQMPVLNFVSISSSGNIETGPNFENVVFDFELSGSGNLTHFTTTELISGVLSGSGNAYIGGSASRQEITLNGSGSFFGFDQPSEKSSLRLSGSGNAEVRLTDSLQAQILGSGSVFYKGSPEVERSGAGSGSVVNAN